jgi:hypothetical protein
MDDEVCCWICGSKLVAKEVVTIEGKAKTFITCDSCYTDLIVID